MDAYDWAWLAWGAAAGISFGALEYMAVRSGNLRNTLSSHLRSWLGIEPRRRWRLAGTAVFVGFLVWLALHIALGIWPG